MKAATMMLATTMCMGSCGDETLPPLKDGDIPRTLEELWLGFDPGKEPLDIEVLKEWEEDGVILRVLRYRIGVFKGNKTMMAAVYGFLPRGGAMLPALVQALGGGQYADYEAPLTNAGSWIDAFGWNDIFQRELKK